MTNATYGEPGLSYAAINWSYDGSELNNGAISPIDIIRIGGITSKPSVPIITLHTPSVTKTSVSTPSIGLSVRYEPSIQRTGTP